MAIVRNENVKNCFECRYFNYNSKKKESECMTDVRCDFTKRRTGVMDKNGIEICEGDYVFYTDSLTKVKTAAVINYSKISSSFRIDFLNVDEIYHLGDYSGITYISLEIIDPDNIEHYIDNGVEKWRIKE